MGKVFPYPSQTEELGVGGMATPFFCVSTDTRDVGLIYSGKDIPSLKLAFSHLKIYEDEISLWGPAYLEVRTVSLRECKSFDTPHSSWTLTKV